MSPGLSFQHSHLWTNLTLLVLLIYSCSIDSSKSKSSKSKNHVMHEDKFKFILSSICQVSVDRRVLDLESEVN